MSTRKTREIPFNYTSADDAQIVRILFGRSTWEDIERIRFKKKTGRLWRAIRSLIGDLFILHRNPFIRHELTSDQRRRETFLKRLKTDLQSIRQRADELPEIQRTYQRLKSRLEFLETELRTGFSLQGKIRRALAPVVGQANIDFHPFTLVSHITDATDWRLFSPAAVVWPEQEAQVPRLLERIQKLGCFAIPRGAGTGLTGGAVPVSGRCIMINTEKMNRIIGIEQRAEEDSPEIPLLHVETGVITGDAIGYAAKRKLVFATDPTSAWACTIGGNIAENAGGKTAVLWGTAIDNLYSFRIATPTGQLLEVKRIGHPLRRILPEDTVRFQVTHVETGEPLHTITLAGTEIRTKGLGKDITNKALNGLPGVQKEGTDGVITTARFVLHQAYPNKCTCCIEFFGEDMDEAGRVILDISREFVDQGREALMALEHFDEAYVQAIDYKVKAPLGGHPKAVLLIDIVGHTTEQLKAGQAKLSRLLQPYPNSFAFFTENREEAERFWQDRKKLGAIAKRTNAFKLNEDIVLPLSALPEFADFVDRCNIEEERENQRAFAWQVSTYLENAEPLADPEWMEAKVPSAKGLLRDCLEKISLAGKHHLQQETHTQRLLQDLMVLFQGYAKVCTEIQAIYRETRAVRIVIATHMHAGDGNVHVNIPVFSNDREMMVRALETADAVMEKTVELGGVVSGEHGIGFTKLKYLDPVQIERLDRYRQVIDPHGIMNPGKLSDPEIPELVYTPSFNLLDLEASIMQHGSLRDLAARISNCVRCGKCKPDCCVFYPRKNLFYHPRNKNLAIAALIEASLYEAQKFRSTRFVFLHHLEEIADHCTICHKCHRPCPVDIDTGEISIMERSLLTAQNKKHTAQATALSLQYLESRSRFFNAFFHRFVVRLGGGVQRHTSRLLSILIKPGSSRFSIPPLLSAPIPPADPGSLRSILPPCGGHQALFIKPSSEWKKTAFYFPGCGSERLFSRIGKAALYILLKAGIAVVLPPPFLCCGFPARVNAKNEMENRITLRNSIILSQIRELFSHLPFDGCAVSCGTCREALQDQQANKLLGTDIVDVSAYALSQALPITELEPGKVFYHQPCHDSLDGRAVSLLSDIERMQAVPIPGCCAEAGTMALSRPDITAAMRDRKRRFIREARQRAVQASTILTNCPSCVQGLGRYAGEKLQVNHLTCALAEICGGKGWEKDLLQLVRNSEVLNL